MVRVAKTYVDTTLWPEFEQFQAVLHEHVATVTKRVIGHALGEAESEVEERDGSGHPGAVLEQRSPAAPNQSNVTNAG